MCDACMWKVINIVISVLLDNLLIHLGFSFGFTPCRRNHVVRLPKQFANADISECFSNWCMKADKVTITKKPIGQFLFWRCTCTAEYSAKGWKLKAWKLCSCCSLILSSVEILFSSRQLKLFKNYVVLLVFCSHTQWWKEHMEIYKTRIES